MVNRILEISRPGRFNPTENANGTGWIGPRNGLDAEIEKKSFNPAGNRTPAIQPVA